MQGRVATDLFSCQWLQAPANHIFVFCLSVFVQVVFLECFLNFFEFIYLFHNKLNYYLIIYFNFNFVKNKGAGKNLIWQMDV